MSCTKPLQVYFTRSADGTKLLHFASKETAAFTARWYDNKNVSLSTSTSCQILPCGKCYSCRLAHSKMWALRCYLESKQYEYSVMLNITYSEKHCPYTTPKDKTLSPRKTLLKSDYQNFLKKLRIEYKRYHLKLNPLCHDTTYKLKYFGCGEYGTKRTKRPHYHFCIFNLKLFDLEFVEYSATGNPLYKSKWLNDLWGKGNIMIGSVNMKSAGYIARYALKKRGTTFDKKDFAKDGKVPEFICMSNGIGKEFFLKHYKSFYAIDSIIVDNQRHTIPRYFDKLLEKIDLTLYEEIKYQRALRSYENLLIDDALPSDLKQTSYERALIKEEIQLNRLKLLRRSYEDAA